MMMMGYEIVSDPQTQLQGSVSDSFYLFIKWILFYYSLYI